MRAPSGFEHGIPGLVIQRPKHYATTRQRVPWTRCLLDGRVYDNQRELEGFSFPIFKLKGATKKCFS